MQPASNRRTFYAIVANNAIAVITNMFVWFALTFWVFLSTQSVLATGLIAGVFAVANMLGSFIFGTIVDHSRKKTAMLVSSAVSFVFYSMAGALYLFSAQSLFSTTTSVTLWLLVVLLMLGSVFGNLRMIALSTVVSLLFTDGKDKANGLIGMVNGLAFSATSVLSGVVIGFFSMGVAIALAAVLTALVFLHLLFLSLPEKEIVPLHEEGEKPKRFDLKKTIAIVAGIPGLFALIFFTTFNNFIGGIFMALMDAYGLSLVSVQVWGFSFAVASFGFILGSAYIATKGLGDNPLRTLLLVNVVAWTTCIFFVIQPWFWLLFVGMVIWMTVSPVVEAAEQTIIQTVVPFERQGRVFGFAHSVEAAASPVTAFLMGPLAQFVFIPFMTTGAGVALLGPWFSVGPDRGIALIFILAGVVGLCVTLIAFYSKAYVRLSDAYAARRDEVAAELSLKDPVERGGVV